MKKKQSKGDDYDCDDLVEIARDLITKRVTLRDIVLCGDAKKAKKAIKHWVALSTMIKDHERSLDKGILEKFLHSGPLPPELPPLPNNG